MILLFVHTCLVAIWLEFVGTELNDVSVEIGNCQSNVMMGGSSELLLGWDLEQNSSDIGYPK